eukprot:scaffold10222_cov135-Isochrysis_galbana.AAC.6
MMRGTRVYGALAAHRRAALEPHHVHFEVTRSLRVEGSPIRPPAGSAAVVRRECVGLAVCRHTRVRPVFATRCAASVLAVCY